MPLDPPGEQIVMEPWPGQPLDRLRELPGREPTAEEIGFENTLPTAPVPI